MVKSNSLKNDSQSILKFLKRLCLNLDISWAALWKEENLLLIKDFKIRLQFSSKFNLWPKT